MDRGRTIIGLGMLAALAAAPALAQTLGAQTTGAQSSAPVNASITVLDPIGLGQVNTGAEAAAVSLPKTGAGVAAVSGGAYTLRGLGGESYTVSMPHSITAVRAGGGEQVEIQLQQSQPSTLPGAAGAPSSTSIAVTGKAPVSSSTAGGAYVGRYGLTVSYP